MRLVSDFSPVFLTLALLTVGLLLGACGAVSGDVEPTEPVKLPPLPAVQEGRFTDVTASSGIDFHHSFGDESFSNLVEAVGGGAAWLDYDGDGKLDVYLATGKNHPEVSRGDAPTPPARNRLYRNRGDGTFADVTSSAGVGAEGHFSMGVTAGDFDGDGRPDLYVCNFGPNLLYRNRGDGTFEEMGARAGVADGRCSVAATWLDFDRDGNLDLYVGNYIRFDPDYNLYYAPDGFPGPLAYAPEDDALYRNRGDGSFEDVSEALGISASGRAMSVIASDLDADGHDDIFVSNDAQENHLYWNEKGQGFVEGALPSGVAYNAAGDSTSHMAVDAGDYDGDGKLDLFVSDSSISSLFQNQGDRFFLDVSIDAGVGIDSAQFVGWGSSFLDFDNDGDLDILKVNADLSRLFGQEAQLFANEEGRFQDRSRDLGDFFQAEWMARATALADYDEDGDLDVLLTNLSQPAVLLRNDAATGSWIELDLRGRGPAAGSNFDAFGATVTIEAAGRTQTAEKRAASGYLSQSSPRLHFGLGDAERIDRIEVVWPSGRTQTLTDVPARQILRLEEPDA